MTTLSLDAALTLLSGAVAYARTAGATVAAVVVDEAGLVVATQRMDGCFPSGNLLAEKKAYAALNLRAATHQAAQAFPADLQKALVAAEPRITFLPGGVPIVLGGTVAGALGVTGGAGDQDVLCCAAAIEALAAVAGVPVN